MTGPLPATNGKLVKTGAPVSDAEGVEPALWNVEYPLELLRANLPASVSDYLPSSLTTPGYELIASKWATVMVWAALYLDTVTTFAQSAPDNLRALDKEKMQAQAMAWFTTTYAMLTATLLTYTDAFKAKATESYDQARGQAVALFLTVKTKAMPYLESWDKKYKLQELYASFKLDDLYASIIIALDLLKKQAMAFMTETWEQIEAMLGGALENERVKSGLKAVKSLPDIASARSWAKQKTQELDPTLHEMTAWLALMYTACSERVAGFMPSE